MLPAPRRERRQEPWLAGIRDVRLHYREGGGERDGFCSSAGAGNRDAVQREERSRELVPIILVLWEKEEEEESWGPRTPRCGTLTLTKVLPEVQVRRWRRLSGRGFMTKSGSYSLLSPPSPPPPPASAPPAASAQGKHVSLVGTLCPKTFSQTMYSTMQCGESPAPFRSG